MKLKVKSRYRGSYQGPSGARQLLEYVHGVTEVDDLLGAYLIRDAPEIFEDVEVDEKEKAKLEAESKATSDAKAKIKARKDADAKAFEEATVDKAVKAPPKKKSGRKG